MKILVVGLGLVGGSVCKTLRATTDHIVDGCDREEKVLEDALADGAISGVGCMEDGVYDLVITCLHQRIAIPMMERAVPYLKKGSILMDMCGLKGQMVVDMTNLCNAYGLYYIGTHPMAGREKSGYYASLPNLFQGANFIITPTEGTNQQAADTVIALAKAMGFGKVVSTSPYRHDTMIAYTSQLAHVVSSAYVKDDCMDDALDFSGGSFQDMTRVATMDEYMWSALFLDNRVELLRHLDMLLKNLIQYRDALQLRDEAALQKLILDGRLIQEENVRKRAKRKEQQG